MRKINISIFSNDIIITLCYIILVLFGFISIYSSQYSEELPFASLKNESFKQLIWILICLIIFLIVQILEYRFIFDLAVPLYFLSIILLVLVLLFGQEVKSSVSWFNFFGLKFQPSEFAKFTTGLALAKYYNSLHTKIKTIQQKTIIQIIILMKFLMKFLRISFQKKTL